jgi:uncharacterized protein YifE (UPF0438 family)
MFRYPPALAGWLRHARLLAMLAFAASFTGCASHYLDRNTKEIPVAQYKKPAQPKPVQLVFEFQTKGTLNTRATDYLKAQVLEQVQATQLFAPVEDKAVAGGALLSITLNNVPLDDSAFSKGFVTGLTFGLAGSTVSDGYVCTVKYLGEGQSEPITKMARHAIHTTMGASAAPENGVKVDNIEIGIRTMTRQVISNALNDLSNDASFK